MTEVNGNKINPITYKIYVESLILKYILFVNNAYFATDISIKILELLNFEGSVN